MAEKLTFDHYEVLTREDGSLFELGRGAMGITYKAFDTNLRVNVALKVINAKFLENEIAQQRFLREARAAAQLRHPNVASVYHLGTSADAFFYAMEFVDGETVESFIKRQGSIDPVVALRITLQVARALAAAEKVHLVHRDIKPANLMLVREDDDFLVKVIDFGLAKSVKHEEDDDLATLSMGGFVGTAHFASPEQLEEKEIDVRSDIYSLGVTLWYMLAGETPFGGSLAQVMSQHLHKPPPLEKLQNLPECVRAAVGHMIEKDPAQRPQTPSALRAELESCIARITSAPAVDEQDFPTMVEGQVATADLHPPPLPPQLPPPKSSSLGMILALVAIVLVGAGAFAFWKMRQPSAVTTTASPTPTASVAATATPAIVQASATPVAASPTPAASLAESPGLTREAIAAAEKYEAARDWPRAIMAYVDLQKKFPQNEVGRVRLELMLSKLQSEKGALRDENFDALREPLTEAAKLQVVSAMEILGEYLRKRDPKASFEWLSAAAARGRAHAMAEVGLRYSNGAGVERDLVKAAQWFEKARAAGDVSARTLLGECYLYGKGVTKDESKAISLFQDAAASNDPRAMDQLGTCYHKGIGVTRDDREAFRFYSAAAKLNNLDSAGNLGVLYLTSDATDLGRNLPARTTKALNLFRDGAKQNNAFCMFLYARCFEGGTGVEANPSEALDWYRRAAEGGNRPAQDWCRQHQVDFDSSAAP